jgi:hypothetical protein
MPGAFQTREFEGYGTGFRLRGNDAASLHAVACRAQTLGWMPRTGPAAGVTYSVVRGGPETGRPGAPLYDLSCDGSLIRAGSDLPDIVEAFEDHAKIETAFRADRHLFVHAGAVAWRGRAILLPGRSRAGKSTLVRALVDAGAEYYSDEFAVLDRAGRVHPYALPLSEREAGTMRRVRTLMGPAGHVSGTRAVPVGLIVVTEYRARARWRPMALSAGEALLALVANTVAARRSPARSMPVLRRVVLGARAIRTPRGDSSRVVQAVLRELP